MDDDDEFLYGSSTAAPAQQQPQHSPPVASVSPQPISLENVSHDVVSHLESKAQETLEDDEEAPPFGGDPTPPPKASGSEPPQTEDDQEDGGDEEEEEEESDDDLEIVLEAPPRSLDLRPNRPAAGRVSSGPIPTGPKAHNQPVTYTTDYTPNTRGEPVPNDRHPQTTGGAPSTAQAAAAVAPPPARSQSHPQVTELAQGQGSASTPGPPSTQPSAADQTQNTAAAVVDDGIDTSTLPPVTAPSSHPTLDPDEQGIYDGRSILDVDLAALADKPWRRPGSDISDWFNYGFDELSWESYCYRRRDLGDLGVVLKTNIINFSGMNEEQLNVLPPEVHTMVMTGANVAMNNAAQGMLGGPGGGMMMDMGGMGGMGMGMGDMGNMGNMGMGGGIMPGMLPDHQTNHMLSNDHQAGMMNPDGSFINPQNPNNQPGGMMGMGDYGAMQGDGGMGMYPMDPSQQVQGQGAVGAPAGPAASTGGVGRGQGFARGRGASTSIPSAPSSRGSGPTRGAFSGRGRGRGYDAPPAAPAVRPASPLPPGVPTGPRNANKYKDRDNNAPAVEGLDYGGGGGGRRTPSAEYEEREQRSSSRRYGSSHDKDRRDRSDKRPRSSPSPDSRHSRRRER